MTRPGGVEIGRLFRCRSMHLKLWLTMTLPVFFKHSIYSTITEQRSFQYVLSPQIQVYQILGVLVELCFVYFAKVGILCT